MRFFRKQESAGAPKWLLPFLAGFLAGVVILNAGADYFLYGSGLLDEYTLGRMRYTQINYHVFFVYVLKKRLFTVWLMLLLSSTFLGIYALYGYAAWLGFSAGVLLSAAIIRYGMKGIILIAAAALPQFILYLPACIILLNLGYRICMKLYSPYRDRGGACAEKRTRLFSLLAAVLVLHVVVITGVLFESYVNPIFVTKILSIF